MKNHNIEKINRGFIGNFLFYLGKILSTIFINTKIVNIDNLPKHKHFIICANHESFIDGLWIASILSREQFKVFSAMGGADLLSDYGLLGKAIAKVGQIIPVQRKGNPMRGLIASKNFIEKGGILLIHPEGGRTKTGRLRKLHEGASYISFKTGVDIVPIYLYGSFEIFGPHYKFPHVFTSSFKRKELIIEIGNIIKVKDYYDSKEVHQELSNILHNFEKKYKT